VWQSKKSKIVKSLKKSNGSEWTEFKWKKQGTTEKRGWSGRTWFHGRHRRSVPIGKIRIECSSISERYRRMSVPFVVANPQNKTEKTLKKKATGVSGQNSSERSKWQQKKEGGVDVLLLMVVTAAVFHLEMSALKAEAE
jgi:hypothetical protein